MSDVYSRKGQRVLWNFVWSLIVLPFPNFQLVRLISQFLKYIPLFLLQMHLFSCTRILTEMKLIFYCVHRRSSSSAINIPLPVTTVPMSIKWFKQWYVWHELWKSSKQNTKRSINTKNRVLCNCLNYGWFNVGCIVNFPKVNTYTRWAGSKVNCVSNYHFEISNVCTHKIK